MKKILITGCGGMLGDAIYNEFNENFDVLATDIDLNEKWLIYLDVRNFYKVEKFIKKYKPNFVFHFAALTDLEVQEKNPYEAYNTNIFGTINIVLACKKYNIPLIYISSAGIFDGKKKIYKDNDIPNPLNVYGYSKYLSELFIKKNLKKYFILRPGWMIGGGVKDKKFISKLIKQLKDGKKEINAIDNIYGIPTYTYDFAKNLKELIKTNKYGIYNMVCKEKMLSRYDVAKEFLKILKLDKKIKLNKVDVSFFEKEYFVLRPKSEALLNNKLESIGLNLMRDWKVCLKEYLTKNENDK